MYECITQIGKIQPKHARDIRTSRIGVGFETLDRSLFDPTHVYDPVGACGVKWARLHSGWARTERERGVYDFAWLDDVIDNLRSRGVEPWLDLVFGNPLHVEITDPGNSPMAWGCPPIHTEAAMEAWKNYVRAIVSHYRGVVRCFEIWNEPDGDCYWKPKGANATEYGIFARETAKVVKETNPSALVFAFALATGVTPRGLTYVKEAMDTGLHEYIDYMTFHRYSYSPEAGISIGTAAMRALLHSYNPKIGLIQGERGCPSENDGYGAMSHMDWDEHKQAKWIARMIVTDLAEDYLFTSYFTTADIPKYRANCNEKWAYFGLVREDRYDPKPGYYALQNLCTVFAGDVRPANLPVLITTSRREGGITGGNGREYPRTDEYISHGFELDGKRYFAYWNPTELPYHSFSSLTTLYVAGKIGKPALIDPLTGAVYGILPEAVTEPISDVRYVRGLPARDYPMILALDGFDGFVPATPADIGSKLCI